MSGRRRWNSSTRSQASSLHHRCRRSSRRTRGRATWWVHVHPDTGRPFFCVPGIRQYHDHPQHSGDSWLLQRHTQEGSLATISDRIWRAMARNVLGIHIEMQTLPGQMQFQLQMRSAPGEVVPEMWRQIEEAAQGVPPGQAHNVPPEVLAALGVTPLPPGPASGRSETRGRSGVHRAFRPGRQDTRATPDGGRTRLRGVCSLGRSRRR